MFELSIALKYLIPRRKQLSVSLIALMSVVVISLVVWLVIVFLSVTEGIERGWLEKLTQLNAPIRITPTSDYYASYYYQIDSVSAASNYSYKTIGEKAEAKLSDPYNPEEDQEISARFGSADRLSNGTLKDPVKIAYQILSDLKKQRRDFAFQEFEISGALMRLQLLRPGANEDSQGFLTQVTYVSSFADQSPYVHSLLLPANERDINHLFYLAGHNIDFSREDAPSLISLASQQKLQSRLQELFQSFQVHTLKPSMGFWKLPPQLLPKEYRLESTLFLRDGQVSHIAIATSASNLKKTQDQEHIKEGFLEKRGPECTFTAKDGSRFSFINPPPLIIEGKLSLNAQLVVQSLNTASRLKDVRFAVQGQLQSAALQGEIVWDGLEIEKSTFKPQISSAPQCSLPWHFRLNQEGGKFVALPDTSRKEVGVLLAKSFQDNGVMIGDRGYFSYAAASASSMQEQRLSIYVAGFYDPGIMAVGAKCVLAPAHVAHLINATGASFNLDKTMSNGISVWFENLQSAKDVQMELKKAFAQAGIEKYWKVSTFHEYDFAKDLLQQFQSDKTLFTLIGGIILVVACCNIISLLVLLVNDKKKEIGILQAMGASPKSIAAIFGFCGIAMGILSSMIGLLAALLTLHHIDAIAQFLSYIQGHDAFNAIFFGKTLPRELSRNAVYFILLTTPFLSLCAGLVPAIKACRMRPSEILRKDS